MSGGPGQADAVHSGPVLAVDASVRPVVSLLGPDGEPWGLWEQTPGTRGTAGLAVEAARLLEGRDLAVTDLAGLAVGLGPGSNTGAEAARMVTSCCFAKASCRSSARGICRATACRALSVSFAASPSSDASSIAPYSGKTKSSAPALAASVTQRVSFAE